MLGLGDNDERNRFMIPVEFPISWVGTVSHGSSFSCPLPVDATWRLDRADHHQ